MIQSAQSFRPSISSDIFSDPSNSLGFGGILPEARTSSCSSPGRCRAALSELTPVNTSDRPIRLFTAKNWSVVGRLKSELTSTTFFPVCAKLAARLAATVDLPSP